MPTYFQRPENALKRANEFIDVGKAQRALDVLYDVIKSKKHRTWQRIHEPIMEKYLELCVDLRKSHIAKEGLYQYKNICQQVNINSLVDVVRKYIALAEERTEAARQESHQTVLDIDDLDLPDSPESLLLKAVSGEDTQDRTDRAILTPWVKFLWESYRQCLDLLRNNSRVERLYQDIAQQAFKFCLKYSRKTEFRKLCDNLRTHLGHVHKHQHQQTAINLNNPESQAMHLETRLVQLDSAINMELWQEAFKAVEDIHGLITLSKKQPKPSLMANYYQKLGLVFAKSGNHLFHASTLHRLFNLSREQRKNLSQEELQRMANRLLCATLAIPIPASRNAVDNLLVMDESGVEKQRRLATLLMLPNPPTRQSLVKDLVKYGALQFITPELTYLYKYLEVEFHPLQLYARVQPLIQFISQNDELSMYVPLLEEIIIARVLKQVAQVYQTIEFKRFASLVPFAVKFKLERVIVGAAKNLELQVRIDHRSGSLSFGTDLGLSQKEEVAEGPTIQSMPSEQIRNQLTSMAQALNKAVDLIGAEKTEEEDELKANIINTYRLTAKKEHTRILQRRQTIEDRKEQLENLNDQREREEQEHLEVARRRAYEAEMARLEREAEERMKQRQEQEHMEIKRKHVRERLEELKKTPQGSKIFQNIDEEEMADLDVDEILAKQVEQLEKEKKELLERLKGQEKKVDYLARAKRIEEIPLLLKQYEEDKKVGREFWEQQEQERIENLKKERLYALETKSRLSKILADSEIFFNSLKKARKSDFEDKLKEFEKNLAVERKKRLADRRIKRREERRNKWIQEKEEEEQRVKDEQLKLEREEQERVAREERDREEKEYAEKLLRLEQQAERQRQREREIEERQRQREVEDRRKDDPDRESLRRKEDGESGFDRVDRDIRSRRDDIVGSDRDRETRDDRKPPTEERDWRSSPRVVPSGGSWRDRVPREELSSREEKGDGWRDKPPKEEKGESWRDRPLREDKEGIRDRPEREGWRDRPREDKKFGWNDRGPRDDRGLRDERVSREDRGPREDRDRDMRGPPKEDRDWRSSPRVVPSGGSWRDRAPREERGDGWREKPREEREGIRDRVPREDRQDSWKPQKDDNSEGWRDRRVEGKESGWRDRPPREEKDGWRDRPPREEKEAWRERLPREEKGDSWRDRPPREEKDSWRDRGSHDDRRPLRDERGSGREEARSSGDQDSWRDKPAALRLEEDRPWRKDGSREEEAKVLPKEEKSRPPRDAGPRAPPKERRNKPEQNEDDDGWTTVRY